MQLFREIPHVCELNDTFEPHHEKTNNVVSEQVIHKLSCTSKEDG